MRRDGRSAAAEVSPIATRAELDRRIASRPKPTIEQRLTIDGWRQQEVHRKLNTFLENRIKALEGRLDKARNGLDRDFRLARPRGQARADFDRSR